MSQPAEKAAPAEAILLREDANGVATLTLNRPKQRNSLSEELMRALTAELNAVAADASVRAVILAASGPAFCAGHDLKELTAARSGGDRGRAFFENTMKLCSTLMQAIVNCPKPVIARVHGIATAAGCQLVA
ncbi:MAG: enoyl-CoA hydratase-related protein, partial [Parvibaculum sp.]